MTNDVQGFGQGGPVIDDQEADVQPEPAPAPLPDKDK